MYKSVPAGAAMALASRAASRLQPAVGVHAAFQFGSSGVLPSQAPSPLSAVAFALAQAPIRRHFGSATVLGAAASDVAGKSLQSASAKLWPSTAELLHGLRSGHRASLAKAITLIESARDDHRQQAELLLDLVLHERLKKQQQQREKSIDVASRGAIARRGAHVHVSAAADESGGAGSSAAAAGTGDPSSAGKDGEAAHSGPKRRNRPSWAVAAGLEPAAASTTPLQHPLDWRKPLQKPEFLPDTFRIGFAGPPGAGKSTLIEAIGMKLVQAGHRVAVVAVDPSSTRSGGSILGDKTRMQELSIHPGAYVRPSPTRGALGGVAQHTADVILLCEGAGYNIVLVETVGLGQSEVAVDGCVDMLWLCVPPGGGDELQGVKKGIVEVADLVVVTKADGDLAAPARHAAAEYGRALQLVRWKHGMDWQPSSLRVSAATKEGLDSLLDVGWSFWSQLGRSGMLLSRRGEQASAWMWSNFESALVSLGKSDKAVAGIAASMQPLLASGYMTSRRAAQELLSTLLRQIVEHRKDGLR